MRHALLPLAPALLALAAPAALAGRCSEIRPFVDTARAAPLVVQATVVRHAQTLLPPSFIEVRVKAVYKGRPTDTVLRVLDPVTSAPVQAASPLPDGSTWILALEPTGDGQGYTFPACGNAYGALIGRFVFANAYGQQDALLPLSDLRDALAR